MGWRGEKAKLERPREREAGKTAKEKNKIIFKNPGTRGEFEKIIEIVKNFGNIQRKRGVTICKLKRLILENVIEFTSEN